MKETKIAKENILNKVVSFFIVLFVGNMIYKEIRQIYPDLLKVRWYEPFIFWRKKI